jgi:hypothetical protein
MASLTLNVTNIHGEEDITMQDEIRVIKKESKKGILEFDILFLTNC